jgi:hypothetical protein
MQKNQTPETISALTLSYEDRIFTYQKNIEILSNQLSNGGKPNAQAAYNVLLDKGVRTGLTSEDKTIANVAMKIILYKGCLNNKIAPSSLALDLAFHAYDISPLSFHCICDAFDDLNKGKHEIPIGYEQMGIVSLLSQMQTPPLYPINYLSMPVRTNIKKKDNDKFTKYIYAFRENLENKKIEFNELEAGVLVDAYHHCVTQKKISMLTSDQLKMVHPHQIKEEVTPNLLEDITVRAIKFLQNGQSFEENFAKKIIQGLEDSYPDQMPKILAKLSS